MNIAGAGVEFATGANALQFENIDSLPDLFKHIGTSALPFAIQGILEGEQAPTVAAGLVGARTSAPTPYERLSEPFRQKYGHDFGDEPGDFRLAEADPDLASLLESYQRSGLARGRQGAVTAEKLDQTRAREEEQADLPDFARRFNAGQTALGPELLKRWLDVQDRMSGAFSEEYGARETRLDSETARSLEEWRSIQATDPKYADPETGVPDYDAYRTDKDTAFAKLPAQLQRAYEQSIDSADPELRALEPQIREALDLRSQLYETPQFRGVSIEQERELRDFYAQVADARRFWFENQGVDVSVSSAIRAVAAKLGKGPNFQQWAMLLRQGSATRDRLRDPAYTRYLVQNEDTLRPFFPELYESRRVLEEVRR